MLTAKYNRPDAGAAVQILFHRTTSRKNDNNKRQVREFFRDKQTNHVSEGSKGCLLSEFSKDYEKSNL